MDKTNNDASDALARLRACSTALADMSAVLDHCHIPVATHTHKVKGGSYEYLGRSTGAGESRGGCLEVYREMVSGLLFHRSSDDFASNMLRIADLPVGAVKEPDVAGLLLGGEYQVSEVVMPTTGRGAVHRGVCVTHVPTGISLTMAGRSLYVARAMAFDTVRKLVSEYRG